MIFAEEGSSSIHRVPGLKVAMMTHKGKVRNKNEDSLGLQVLSQKRGFLLVVTDGMGGHKAGEVASQIVVEKVLQELDGIEVELSHEEVFDSLLFALSKADEEVKHRGEEDLKYHGMGATAVLTWVEPHRSIHLYVGDSRFYHIREEEILYRTKDHTVVQTLLEAGRIIEEDIADHPSKHMLLSSLGGVDDKRQLDISPKWEDGTAFSPLEKGDLLLLCTDGLSNAFLDKELLYLIKGKKDPEEIIDLLMSKALDDGGEDNISAAVVSIEN